jgi:3-hydroxybutyryl-CoA dehydratase
MYILNAGTEEGLLRVCQHFFDVSVHQKGYQMLAPSEATSSIHDVKIGDAVVLEKTIGESDIYLFGGITGDLHAVHINERYMSKSPFGRRIAQGALILGFGSAAAGAFANKYGIAGVTAGYDRIRMVKPVFIGDTVRVEYRISRIELERSRSYASLNFSNQHGEIVLVGEHIIKYFDPSTEAVNSDPI